MKVNESGITFEQWLEEADAYVGYKVGLSLDCLGDAMTYDAWADGWDPVVFAEDRLVSTGFPVSDTAVSEAAVGGTDWAAEVVLPSDDDEAILAAERARRTSRTKVRRRKVDAPYVPRTVAVEAALRERRRTGRLPILY